MYTLTESTRRHFLLRCTEINCWLPCLALVHGVNHERDDEGRGRTLEEPEGHLGMASFSDYFASSRSGQQQQYKDFAKTSVPQLTSTQYDGKLEEIGKGSRCGKHQMITKQSRKFCPEAIMFLRTLLMAAMDKKPGPCSESQVYHLMELKVLRPLLRIRGGVNEISPLDFLLLLGLPEDCSYFNSDNFSFVKGRDYDPDHERAEQRKIRKLVKREAKGSARELRKDNYFLSEVKASDKVRLEEERAEKYGKARAFLQEQEHAFKSGQLGKGRKRRRYSQLQAFRKLLPSVVHLSLDGTYYWS
ncbi:hypothetical protein RJ639_027110 [Escallonia herrerae]|uniref:Uncharacterized protein n=1 Tax=Escallonia herrerae TaxID=1293975 RepID=A0AA89BKD4_9ASTE|nr:hypothetical protein RJ639_027110 [Escallonia herrerae]